MEKRVVKIKKAPVELYKILKFENLTSSGGEAKYMILDGFVKVNGRIETQKRKKIYPDDIIEAGGYVMEIKEADDAYYHEIKSMQCHFKYRDRGPYALPKNNPDG